MSFSDATEARSKESMLKFATGCMVCGICAFSSERTADNVRSVLGVGNNEEAAQEPVPTGRGAASLLKNPGCVAPPADRNRSRGFHAGLSVGNVMWGAFLRRTVIIISLIKASIFYPKRRRPRQRRLPVA